MKGICKTLGGVALVLGVIGTIVLAVAGGKTADYGRYAVDYERNWSLTIGYLFGGGLYTAFTTTVFFALSEILEDLEGVKYIQNEMLKNIHKLEQKNATITNSSGSADVSSSNINVSDANSSIYGTIGEGGWTCPECNRKHRSFENSCPCGYEKE